MDQRGKLQQGWKGAGIPTCALDSTLKGHLLWLGLIALWQLEPMEDPNPRYVVIRPCMYLHRDVFYTLFNAFILFPIPWAHRADVKICKYAVLG